MTVQKTQCLPFCSTKSNLENKTDDNAEINLFVSRLQKILCCTKPQAIDIYEILSFNRDRIDLGAINKTVNWLSKSGATLPVVAANAHILVTPLGESFIH